jgi:hypothetical protein
MSDTNQRAVAESVFERNQRREAEINDALKQEEARRAAVIANMYRLRALRVATRSASGPLGFRIRGLFITNDYSLFGFSSRAKRLG